MSPMALGASGSSQPHNNMQPFLGLNFIICYNGDFPQRS
jgi:microcystin-dependent protein